MRENLVTEPTLNQLTDDRPTSTGSSSDYLISSAFIACLLLFLACSAYALNNKPEIAAKTYTAKDLDISNVSNTADKKKHFFDFMRPIIIQENQKILALRKKLNTAKIYNNQNAFVAKIANEYKVEWNNNEKNKREKNWEKLLERVDAVSLEVALAQSANESAWGQSRFAQQGNNLFGQWCYKKGCGMIPAKRGRHSKHEVASYDTVNESVRSYIKNINTTRAYEPLRKVRKQNRVNKLPVNAKDQATGLILYSQRRDKYVKEIIQMIQSNQTLMTGKTTINRQISFLN